MNRRELLNRIAALTGVAVIGGDVFLMQVNAAPISFGNTALRFTAREINLLDEIGETIIPTTDTPGAKAAKTGKFMEVMVRDCYTIPQQNAFMSGLKAFPEECMQQYGKSFFSMTTRQRHDLLVTLEKEAKAFNETQQERDKNRRHVLETENKDNSYAMQKEFEALPRHFYTMVKQLTLLGFFTSQTGMTKTLRYVAIPGRYDGNVPYIKGQRAWA